MHGSLRPALSIQRNNFASFMLLTLKPTHRSNRTNRWVKAPVQGWPAAFSQISHQLTSLCKGAPYPTLAQARSNDTSINPVWGKPVWIPAEHERHLPKLHAFIPMAWNEVLIVLLGWASMIIICTHEYKVLYYKVLLTYLMESWILFGRIWQWGSFRSFSYSNVI